jgi:hypothetical protein
MLKQIDENKISEHHSAKNYTTVFIFDGVPLAFSVKDIADRISGEINRQFGLTTSAMGYFQDSQKGTVHKTIYQITFSAIDFFILYRETRNEDILGKLDAHLELLHFADFYLQIDRMISEHEEGYHSNEDDIPHVKTNFQRG